jgi:hypothetical protein
VSARGRPAVTIATSTTPAAQRRTGKTSGPQRSRTDVRCDHRSNLVDELRLRAEHLGESVCQPLGVLVRIRVLDEPSISAHRTAFSHQFDQPLDPAPARAHDVLDLGLDCNDRLEVERRSDSCGGHERSPPAAHLSDPDARSGTSPTVCALPLVTRDVELADPMIHSVPSDRQRWIRRAGGAS